MRCEFRDRGITRLLVLFVYLASESGRDLDDHMIRYIRQCWAGLQDDRSLAPERDVFWSALHRYYQRGYPVSLLSELTEIGSHYMLVHLEAQALKTVVRRGRVKPVRPSAGLYPVNAAALDDPSLPITGYVLGILWAQALLMQTHYGTYEGFRIILPLQDRSQLEFIRTCLGSTAPIIYPRPRVPAIERSSLQCELRIDSPELAGRLVDYRFGDRNGGGPGPRSVAPPAEIRVAEVAFWRGLFDGHGSIHLGSEERSPQCGCWLELSANRATCELFRDWILDRLPHARIELSPPGRSARFLTLTARGPSAVGILALLYPPGCIIGLTRNVRTARSIAKAAASTLNAMTRRPHSFGTSHPD